MGSARVVTDSNKNIVSAVMYHPFGEISTQEGTENYLYNGKEKDATDLYYYGARYYDSELGRFLTRDPFSGNMLQPQSLNRHSYCINNPLKFIDPLGLHYYHITDSDGNEYTLRYGDDGTVYIGTKVEGIWYTWKISNNYKDWDLFWEDEEGFHELSLMKNCEISCVEGKAFYLGFCLWGTFKNQNSPLDGYKNPLEYAKAKFGKENVEKFEKFFGIGRMFGKWAIRFDYELYRLYCPAPFNDTAWKNMANKMAVELVFSYPWNPFPMYMFWKWIAAEGALRTIKKMLYPEE